MKEILIDKEIGGDWFSVGITASQIRKEFESAGEDDIRLVVDCPGGDCFEGISIYNFIRDYARNHNNTITTYIQGMAASAASWIALAANSVDEKNKVIIEDNSIFMIHNSWGVVCGDHREMEKSANFVKRIDGLINKMLANRSLKDEREIAKLMDAETWFFGSEITENGFADEMILTGSVGAEGEEGFNTLMDKAVASFKNCRMKIEDEAKKHQREYRDCLEKSLSAFNLVVEIKNKKPDDGKKTKEVLMNKQELLATNKALYDEIYNEGVMAERGRCQSHLKMASDSGDMAAAVEFINSGANCGDNAVVAKYHEVFTKQKLLNARKDDEPPVVDTTKSMNANAEESQKVADEAFAKITGLKG